MFRAATGEHLLNLPAHRSFDEAAITLCGVRKVVFDNTGLMASCGCVQFPLSHLMPRLLCFACCADRRLE